MDIETSYNKKLFVYYKGFLRIKLPFNSYIKFYTYSIVFLLFNGKIKIYFNKKTLKLIPLKKEC